MAKNPKNNDACNLLAAAISEIKHTGEVYIRNASLLIKANAALLNEPPPCPADCRWRDGNRPQKCNCCTRNYKRLKDLYERW